MERQALIRVSAAIRDAVRSSRCRLPFWREGISGVADHRRTTASPRYRPERIRQEVYDLKNPAYV